MKALKELDAENNLPTVLKGFNKKVSCYIVNTKNVALLNYGQMRGNQLSAQFYKKPLAQDLLHVFGVLKKETGESTGELLKVLERYAIFQLIRDEDISALKKICKWDDENFQTLLKVLSKYERKSTTR